MARAPAGLQHEPEQDIMLPPPIMLGLEPDLPTPLRKTVSEQGKKTGVYKVLMPAERNIRLTTDEIVESLRTGIMHSELETFTDVCQLLEAGAAWEFAPIRRRLKRNFRFFSDAALKRSTPTRKGKGIKKEDVLNEMEVAFLKDLWDLMEDAHYRTLSEADWIAVKQERLMLDMPMQLNWEHTDARMLQRFYARYPDLAKGQYRFKDHMLVFHRGVGVVHIRDRFIPQKVDLLAKYLVAWPAKQVLYFVASLLPRFKRLAEYAQALHAKDVEDDMSPNDTHASASDGLDHPNAKVIERTSLRRLLPSYKSVLGSFTAALEIKEPTFKDVFTVYRKKVPAPTQAQVKKNPKLWPTYRRDSRGIVVKRFDEIPIADLEILYPDKEVGLKLIDQLTLYSTAIAAVVGGVTALLADVRLSFVMSTLMVVGGRLFQTYSRIQAKRADSLKQMAQTVYDISMDAQDGAIYSILDDMTDQYVKESLLAYFLLLKHRYPATEAEIDKICEDYMHDKFDVQIDFAIEDTLPRLYRDGLVMHKDPDDPRFLAVPMHVAQENLKKKWQRAFSYSEEADNAAVARGRPRFMKAFKVLRKALDSPTRAAFSPKRAGTPKAPSSPSPSSTSGRTGQSRRWLFRRGKEER